MPSGEGEKIPSEFMSGKDGFSKNPTNMPLKPYEGNEPGSDYGKGSTNENQKGKEIKEKPFRDRQNNDKSEKQENFVRIYGEKHIDKEKSITKVSGQKGEGAFLGSSPSKGAPVKPELSYKPYNEVYKEYKEKAEKSINEEKIPKGYKYLVRKYFEEIKPEKEE